MLSPQVSTMKRSKQTARRSVTNYDIERSYQMKMKKKNELLKEHNWTFAYVMIRLIDIRDKIDVTHITADNVFDKLYNHGDIYNLFGMINEIDADAHILVGIQSRRYMCDRLDAYILVGLKVMEESNLDYTIGFPLSINAALSKEGCNIDVSEENYLVFYGDEDITKWCINIIKDMEDFAEDGDINFIM
jgi:hypothetical protein